MGELIGVDQSSVNEALGRPIPCIKSTWIIKEGSAGEEIEWDDLIEAASNAYRDVVAINLTTNKVYITSSAGETARVTGIVKGSVCRILRDNAYIGKGHLIYYMGDRSEKLKNTIYKYGLPEPL
jgi:hypothetical protein